MQPPPPPGQPPQPPQQRPWQPPPGQYPTQPYPPNPYAPPYVQRPITRPPRWRDDLNPLYVLIVVFGVIGALILTAGAFEFLIFEPLGQNTGMKARIEGVYAYNPSTHETHGARNDRFSQSQAFAAVVDWHSLPSGLTVDARWYNSFGEDVGGVGPETTDTLQSEDRRGIVPAAIPKGLDKNLPGHYLFVIERWHNGQPVEVIGREIVLVVRGSS